MTWQLNLGVSESNMDMTYPLQEVAEISNDATLCSIACHERVVQMFEEEQPYHHGHSDRVDKGRKRALHVS